jgi:membrane carboxypeptidase/penicillin-binding protein
MTMRSALKISSNRAAVQLLNTVGIPNAVSFAEKLNVGTPPSVPSLALGASDVTLLSLTSAYGAFADEGHRPHARPAAPRRRQRRQGALRGEGKIGARHQRGERVPDVEHARRRHQLRHRLPGAAVRLHAAGGRQDRDDQRLRRTRGSSATRRTS